MKRLIFIFMSIILFSSQTSADEKFIEIKIPCSENSQAQAILPDGEIISLGRVLMTPTKTNYPAYTASRWSGNSTVCASAVNAIHILINVENEKGRIISLVPSVTIAPAAERGSFFSIECEAGTGLFGGFAPLTGSKVFISRGETEIPFTDVPESGDILIIRTKLPENPEFFMVDIENRPGGRVIAHGTHGVKVIARVIRPVGGVGRFEGTKFQSVGRIRASHSGVIDISTSRRGEIGGIQIMPLKHALTSKEMINAWKLTQWMIISPLPNMPDLEGQTPLYKDSFVPGTQLNDRLPDLFSHYGRKSLILCRIDGGQWQRLPEVSGRVDDALKNITHLRLYFPFWNLGE